MLLPQRLKELRNSKGLSQSALADILGRTQQAIGKWEVGKAEPDVPTLLKLATYFNVTIDYLLGRTNNPRSFPKKLPYDITGKSPLAQKARATTKDGEHLDASDIYNKHRQEHLELLKRARQHEPGFDYQKERMALDERYKDAPKIYMATDEFPPLKPPMNFEEYSLILKLRNTDDATRKMIFEYINGVYALFLLEQTKNFSQPSSEKETEQETK